MAGFQTERHTEEAGPGWYTKVRCSCGAEFASRAELWKHQATALRALMDEMGDE